MVMHITVIYKFFVLLGVFLKTETVAVGLNDVPIDFKRVWDSFPVGFVEEPVLLVLFINHVPCILDWLFVTNKVVFTCDWVFFLQPFNDTICGR